MLCFVVLFCFGLQAISAPALGRSNTYTLACCRSLQCVPVAGRQGARPARFERSARDLAPAQTLERLVRKAGSSRASAFVEIKSARAVRGENQALLSKPSLLSQKTRCLLRSQLSASKAANSLFSLCFAFMLAAGSRASARCTICGATAAAITSITARRNSSSYSCQVNQCSVENDAQLVFLISIRSS